MIWLKTALFGLPRFIWLLGVAAALLTFVVHLRNAERADDSANQTIGQVTERAATTGQVLERVEQGNATRNEIEAEADRGTGTSLYNECVRAYVGNTPEVCQRFLPQRPAAER